MNRRPTSPLELLGVTDVTLQTDEGPVPLDISRGADRAVLIGAIDRSELPREVKALAGIIIDPISMFDPERRAALLGPHKLKPSKPMSAKQRRKLRRTMRNLRA